MRQLRTSNKPESQKNFSAPEINTESLASCFNQIMETVREDGYTPEVLESLRGALDAVEAKLPVNDTQAVLISYLLEARSSNRCDESDMAEFLGCSNIQFISFNDELDDLVRRRLLRNDRYRGRYRLDDGLVKAISKDVKYEPKPISGLTTNEIFTEFRRAFSNYSNSNDEERLLRDFDEIVDANPQSPFVRALLDSSLRECSDTEQRIFYCLAHRYVSFGDESIEIDRLMDLGEEFEDMSLFKRLLGKEKTKMQETGLVAFSNENGFVDNTKLSLSEEVRAGWFPDVDIVVEKVQHRDLKSWESITAKELYYNAGEVAQMERLENLLQEDNFKGVLERLSETGMRKNFTILLTGGPGVGKTETCLQLARKTHRDIFYVDMSKLKSKWFGESEKIVASIFGNYRQMVATSDVAPILLLNECDAIMGKRFEGVQSSSEQADNSIQNIILQNMESLEGIMICTTNLAQNLDDAFARRFLYKVELTSPNAETRAKIWMSMMPKLSESDAQSLSREFSFAGGNIENVARKSAVEYILSGEEPALETLKGFCTEETGSCKKPRPRVGY